MSCSGISKELIKKLSSKQAAYIYDLIALFNKSGKAGAVNCIG